MLVITHHPLHEGPGKITVSSLIIRNSPASLFGLTGTMIHTAGSLIALAAGKLRTISLTHPSPTVQSLTRCILGPKLTLCFIPLPCLTISSLNFFFLLFLLLVSLKAAFNHFWNKGGYFKLFLFTDVNVEQQNRSFSDLHFSNTEHCHYTDT